MKFFRSSLQTTSKYIITIEFDDYIKGDFAVHHEQLFAFGERESFRDDFNKGEPLETPFNQGPKYGGASISLE